jgi:hypothetical protein
MLAVAVRAQHGETGARQYDRRYGQEREQRAPERDLAQRIAVKLPFHDRIAAREHHGRQDHVEDAARDLVAPRDERIWGGHQAAKGLITSLTPSRSKSRRLREHKMREAT